VSESSKYIFVTGGVTSSLGKGIISASLGKLLKSRNYSVTIQKLDPYINVDPGTMNPYEHGECYVTEDGAETDLDLGHYERFLNEHTSSENNVTTGSIYQKVINKERRGDYLGKTVQIIPHITDEIKKRIQLLSSKQNYDFIITEIGGTVGDIESLPYIEAVRQLKRELKEKCIFIHLTLVPYLSAAGELKTKPTQHSVKLLLESGIQPDILVCRTEKELSEKLKNKISLFCNVDIDSVIQSIDAESIYKVPILMKEEKLDLVVLKKLNVSHNNKINLVEWTNFLDKLENPKNNIKIALVGKYVQLTDSYKSIIEAITHASTHFEVKVDLKLINSEEILENNLCEKFNNVQGIIVAPGFGERGIEGKILSVRYCRKNNIPFFGICLGMQCAVIEYMRNVLGKKGASTSEIDKTTSTPVIDLMHNQKQIKEKGGSMRLGSYECKLIENTIVSSSYNKKIISERHRHRYEFNNNFRELFFSKDMIISGYNPKNNLVEIIELKSHPWFVGVQFHPEYKSTVQNPHPLFISFINSIIKNHEK
tara:strand:+ start:45489 stop:47102 length:1614 start_codon:yes stop_codon:yes gene_type:complete